MAGGALAGLLAGLATEGGTEVPEAWKQGRTAYGGFGAALAFQAARAALGDGPPPLRSAQVAFFGPLSGRVTASAGLLRRGRSAAFVAADLAGADGPALSARFAFGGGRPSALTRSAPPPPAHASLAPGGMPRVMPPDAPAFFRNFAMAHAVPKEAQAPGDMIAWMRLAEPSGLDPVADLVLLGDGLPPAAMTLARERGPISSMTWQFDLLTERPATRDGWWLLRSTATQAADGFSSQAMSAWNANGEQVMAGMQTVALFF